MGHPVPIHCTGEPIVVIAPIRVSLLPPVISIGDVVAFASTIKKFQNNSDLPVSAFSQWREAYFRLSRRKFPAGNTGKLSAMVVLAWI
jgi:hypothetical protein